MTILERIRGLRQPILMVICTLLILGFFVPWVTNNPDLETFAYSEIKLSGFDIFRGYQSLVAVVDPLISTLGYAALGKLLYLGYILILLPVISVASIVLLGIRHAKASLVTWINFVAHTVLVLGLFLLIMINGDLRTLFFTIMSFSLGYYLMMLMSILGVVTLVITRRK
ncbi:MAG: hypothetical protein BGO41_10895 [Clostridiales bacterium 38-18]|nr:MAG: hypothetical protein BGO41_10895 [Clostridiales bacterium 38-18]